MAILAGIVCIHPITTGMQFAPPPQIPPAIHAPAPVRTMSAIPVRRNAVPIAGRGVSAHAATRPMPCTIIGDSIAEGVGDVTGWRRIATRGISSDVISARTPNVTGGCAVISAGSNDPLNPRLFANLQAIRARSGARQLVWIAPHHPRAEAAVVRVAAQHGDEVVYLRTLATDDRVHPKSYTALSAAVRRRLGF